MELYIGKQHGEIGIEDAEELMRQYPGYARRALASAIKSESWRMRGLIKKTIQGGGPGGSWKKLNPHTGILNKYKNGKWMKNYRKSRKGVARGAEAKRIWRDDKGHVRQRLSSRTEPLTRLAGGTRYYFDNNMLVSHIGFLSGHSPGATTILAKKHAMGFKVPVTAKSRRWAFGLGFPLRKEKREIVISPRPVVGPVFQQEQGAIIANINRKVPEKIREYAGKK